MRYHDAARPHDANGWGRIVAPNGTVLGPLQGLILEPRIAGDWEVRMHLQRGPSTFREYAFVIELEEIEDLLRRWQENPEGVLEEYFGYDFKMDSHATAPRAAPTSRSPTTLEDLGL